MELTPKRIKELERAEAKLNALEAGGVDNWDGYDFSLKEYRKTIEVEEKMEEMLDKIEIELFQGVYEPSERGAGYTTTSECSKKAFTILQTGVKELLRRNKKD